MSDDNHSEDQMLNTSSIEPVVKGSASVHEEMEAPAAEAGLDVSRIKQDFPILQRQVFGRRLVYLDNAATSQKPQSVIDAISDYYSGYNSNVHRGVHTLAAEATAAYEEARKKERYYL